MIDEAPYKVVHCNSIMCAAVGNDDEISMEEFVFLLVVDKWMESSTAVVPVKGLGSILAYKSIIL